MDGRREKGERGREDERAGQATREEIQAVHSDVFLRCNSSLQCIVQLLKTHFVASSCRNLVRQC